MSDDAMETITIAAGRTVMTGRSFPPKAHGPGTRLEVSSAEAAQLRASGHAIDLAASPVRAHNPVGTTTAAGVIEVAPQGPLVNPGTIGGAK